MKRVPLKILGRAALVWAGICVLAVINGAFRVAVIIPLAGAYAGHVISTIILCALIYLTARLTFRRMGIRVARDAVAVGVLWLLMTVAFEFLAGHYLFGSPWATLLADYDLSRGRVWILVLLATLHAPLAAFRAGIHRGLERFVLKPAPAFVPPDGGEPVVIFSLADKYQRQCRHYSVLPLGVCRAKIPFTSVAFFDDDRRLRIPCLLAGAGDAAALETCPAASFPTVEEGMAEEARTHSDFISFLEEFLLRPCPTCGTPIESRYMLNGLLHATPCGHRLYRMIP